VSSAEAAASEAAPRIQPGESERCIKLKFSTKAILNNARSPFCYLFVWLGASQSAPTTIIRAARNHGLLSGGGCRIIWRPAKLVVCEIASKVERKKGYQNEFDKKAGGNY
jgi:hypothetical protein